MLKRLLINIRQKPKPVRDNIALAIAGVFTAVVCTVWIFNAPSKYSASINNSQSEEDKSPGFADIFSNIGQQFATVKESVVDSAPEIREKESLVENDSDVLPAGVAVATTSGSGVSSTTTASSTVLTGQETASSTASTTTAARPIRIVAVKSTTTATTTTGQ